MDAPLRRVYSSTPTRWMFVVMSAVAAVFFASVIADPGAGGIGLRVICAVALLAALVHLVRSWRQGTEVDPQLIVVRGRWRTREVPTNRVVGIGRKRVLRALMATLVVDDGSEVPLPTLEMTGVLGRRQVDEMVRELESRFNPTPGSRPH